MKYFFINALVRTRRGCKGKRDCLPHRLMSANLRSLVPHICHQTRAQEALRVVVFLISHGADARAVNNVGDTPLDIAIRLTRGFSKTRGLLISILDSSKHEVKGGALFIVPGNPRITDMDNEDADGVPEYQCPEVRVRGMRFLPSRRIARARGKREISDTQRDDNRPTPISFTNGVGELTSALPRGDHEALIGGAQYRLAERFSSYRRPRSVQARDTAGAQDPARSRTHVERRRGCNTSIAVMFKDFRMGKSSAVLSNRRTQDRASAISGAQPTTTCTMRRVETTLGRMEARKWPTTSSSYNLSKTNLFHCRRRGNRIDGKEEYVWECTDVYDKRVKRSARGNNNRKGTPSLSNSEALEKISQWLRRSARNASAMPPPSGHAVGGHLTETSSFVAADSRSDIYDALHAIKGESPGELISADRLRGALCRTGQYFQAADMDALLQEIDPKNTGWVAA